MKLLDKVAIITGSANGIGKGIALKLAEHGANVVVSDTSLMAAEDLCEKIEDMGRKSIPVKADVTIMEDVEQMVSQAIAEFDRVDILVSNAGIRKDAPIQNMTDAEWNRVIDTQLKGCFNTVRLAQKHMVKQGYGKIIIVSSPIPSGLGSAGQTNYSAANAGLAGMTVSLALELGKYNINVNCIAPDFIETQMIRENIRQENMYLEDLKKALPSQIALRRLGKVEDVGNVAVFLASDESSYVTGQIIHVKGGP